MKIRRKQRQKRTHAVKWALVVVLAALCFVGYWGVQGVYRVVEGWASDPTLPSIDDADFTNHAQESVMYADDEQTLLAEFQLEKRDPVEWGQVSEYALNGTVDTEDVRFYDHEGVDLAGIMRAFINNLSGGSLEGASTITQQLVRNTLLTQEANDISLERKIREAELAVEMEERFSKDEILLMYLNTINYGDGCYGIEAAAQNYFQVSAADLSLTQAATLVGIPQSPTYLNPKEYPEACLTRRNVVLDRMLSAGDITAEEHAAAQAEELNLNPSPATPEKGIHAYPYFTEYVRQLLLAEDNPYGVSYADLFEGGLTIYTSLDPTMQDQAEDACEAQNARMADNLESSLVAVDPDTGYIKAMVGGKDFYTDEYNIAAMGGRPTGSTFKAFTLATAIEQGINPQTLIDCSNPLTMASGNQLWNFGQINYGTRSIQSATAISSNTGYYRLMEQVTPASTIEMARRLGVTGQMQNLPIITLGTENTTPLEMAAAYGVFAADGVRHDTVAITKIVNKDGETIYEAVDSQARVLTEEVAGAVTKVLRTVFESSEGTAYGFGPSNGQPVAGKTGTGQEFRDHWLVGYTPNLSCAVWIGDRNYESTDENLTANALWQDFMSRATAGQAITPFTDTKDPEYNNPFNTAQGTALSNTTTTTENDDASNAPNVVGMTLSEAQSQLSSYSVSVVEEYSSTVAAGTVISQAGQGSTVTIVISRGPDPNASDSAATTTPEPATPEPDNSDSGSDPEPET